jgi:hypothetical protein
MTPTMKGAVAGAIGGLAGTLAMNYAQRLWTLASDGAPPPSAADKHDARDWQERDEGQNANEIAAQAVATRVIDRPLNDNELSLAAPIVHFSFGAAIGAMYGATLAQSNGRGSSIQLGTALWASADEIAMPAIGLSWPTTHRPLEMHLQSLVSHFVYGIVTERVRRLAMRAL